MSHDSHDEKLTPINEKAGGYAGGDNVVPVKTAQSQHVGGLHVLGAKADEAAAIAAKFAGQELDPVEAERVRRKIDWHILPLMMTLYLLQFLDKTTLGYSAVLGLQTDCHLTTTQYNLLGTFFYVSYLAFEWPQNIGLQRFPVGKYLATNCTCWGIFLCCFAACHNFTGLAILRILLGLCEGSITAGFMIVTSMFYTRKEQVVRTSYWFLMNGSAQILGGLLAFAVQHRSKEANAAFASWRIFYLICGGMTLACGLAYFLFFPDSPITARFLTEEEKWVALERIRVNQTGTENKHWKKDQFWEALRDPMVWAFFVFAALDNVPNSLTNQNSLIIKSLGFSTKKTTLLGMVSGAVEIVTIWSSALVIKRFQGNKRSIIAAIWMIPNVIGAILVITLPYSNKTGILASLYVTGVGTPGFVIALAWVGSATSGHTKKLTANALFLIGYCMGNLLAPLMWKEEYKPRNYVPWAVIAVCYSLCIVIVLGIGAYYRSENMRRDRLAAEGAIDNDPYGYIDEVQEDGTVVTHKVDKAFMDLTDKQNMAFRYPY